MLVIAQGMVLICASCGLLMYLYIHVFSFRRLRHQERRLDRDESRLDREMAVSSETGSKLTAVGMAPAQTEAALFYLYQEQLRRFIDAKIDIMRSSAETQNRIMVIEAETVRNAAGRLPPPQIDIDQNGNAVLPVVREEVRPLSDKLHTVRTETERHLAEIDEQMRSLPGPSLNQWTAALNERGAMGEVGL